MSPVVLKKLMTIRRQQLGKLSQRKHSPRQHRDYYCAAHLNLQRPCTGTSLYPPRNGQSQISDTKSMFGECQARLVRTKSSGQKHAQNALEHIRHGCSRDAQDSLETKNKLAKWTFPANMTRSNPSFFRALLISFLYYIALVAPACSSLSTVSPFLWY